MRAPMPHFFNRHSQSAPLAAVVRRPQRQEENMEFICAQRVFLPLHVQGSYEDTYQPSTSLHTV
jgi:hypothetical protein